MPNTITKTSKNTNCLEGVKCPKCGPEDLFKIAASVIVEVSDDGTEDQGGGYEWDQQTFCQCCECDHGGKLADFTIENWGKRKNKEKKAAPLWTLETQYQSAERKMTKGRLTLRDEHGEYLGQIDGRPDVVAALLKSGLVSKVSGEG